MHEYNEEEIELFGREGGAFLIRNGIVDTDSLEEIKAYKRGIEEEEIEKTEGRGSFNIFKVRGDNEMENEFNDSAYNDGDEELRDLIEEFLDEEIDEDFEKALKETPEKLKEALGEAYKILIEYKDEMKDIPELLEAVKLMARIATGKPGKYPYPEKYPYPKKVKKSMNWSQVQDMLFGGHLPPADDYEVEKSSKENPFPSITRALKIKKEAIDELENELEESSFDPYDRMA